MSPMNPRKLVPTQEPGILDFAPGAAAAYSLRSLSNSYAGPVVTVRRSTDNAEADFTASEVSDGTLAAWCGGGDGFVKVWHDQSQHGRDASQATAANQPKIVASGALVLSEGRPALLFAEVNDNSVIRLQTSAFSPAVAQPFTVFVVAERRLNDDRQTIFSSRTGNVFFGHEAASGVFNASAGTALSYGAKATGTLLHSGVFYSASSSAYINGALGASGDTGTNSLDGITLGHVGGVPSVIANGYCLIGTISEAIIYPADMTALRTRIEGNLAWYY